MIWKQTEYSLLYTRAITLIVRVSLHFIMNDNKRMITNFYQRFFNYEYANNVRFLQVLTVQNTI